MAGRILLICCFFVVFFCCSNRFTPEDVKAAGIKLRPRNISGMPGYMSDGSGIPFHRNLVPLDDDFFYKIQAV